MSAKLSVAQNVLSESAAKIFERTKALQLTFSECATNHRILDTSNRRIVGGKNAVPNTLPWQVFIRINRAFRCGGSVLNRVKTI